MDWFAWYLSRIPRFDEHLVEQFLDSRSPRIPVQPVIERGPTRFHQFGVALIILVQSRDDLGVGCASRTHREHEPVFTVSDDASYASGVGRDNRQTECVGLRENDGRAVAPGW